MYRTNIRRLQLDGMLLKREFPKLKNGYIWEIRHALGMTGTQLARRLKLAPSTVHELESSEKNGTITLNSLQKCAEAMGCRLVYAIVPETSLDEIVKEQAMKRSIELASNVQRTMALERQSVTNDATQSMIRDKADELRLRGGRELWT